MTSVHYSPSRRAWRVDWRTETGKQTRVFQTHDAALLFRKGLPEPPRGRGGVIVPLDERLLRRRVVTTTGCWEWRGYLGKSGYHSLSVRTPEGIRSRLLHRVAYEFYVGPIPDGMQLDHLCRNTACHNPDHLEPVTASENVLRRWAATKARASA